MRGYGGFGAIAGLGGFGMIVGMLFWVGLILLVVWAAVQLFSGPREYRRDTPLEILKRRYARGEITQTEYLQAVKDLS